MKTGSTTAALTSLANAFISRMTRSDSPGSRITSPYTGQDLPVTAGMVVVSPL